MNGHEFRYRRWGVFFGALVFSVFVGLIAYNAGLSHGVAQGAVAAGSGAPYPYPYPYAYGWHRPWGFGFGFPLLFLAFWFLVFRRARWGGPWRRHPYWRGAYGPYGYDFQPPLQPPSAFDEWHRQAHERMKEPPPADDPGRGR